MGNFLEQDSDNGIGEDVCGLGTFNISSTIDLWNTIHIGISSFAQ